MPPIHVMLKPASGLCNMRCKYCFYADEMSHRAVSSYGMMATETLDTIVRKSMEIAEGDCTFGFQGGEPLLAGIEFFRTLVALQQKYGKKGLRVHNALQTNGLLINEEWAAFFTEHKFLLGVSLDGTQSLHDLYRRDAAGQGTFQRIMAGIRLLTQYHVDYNILTVVTAQTARNIREVYRFFARQGLRYQQYIPCLDPLEKERGQNAYSLTPAQYGNFLKKLFDLWYDDVTHGRFIYIRYFENLLGMMMGRCPESCGILGVCARQYIIEADGSVYPCDFYMMDQYRLGNLLTDSFTRLDGRREELQFVEKSAVWPARCRSCRWQALCRNGCYRDRVPAEKESVPINFFCEAYREFFAYAVPRLELLCRGLRP